MWAQPRRGGGQSQHQLNVADGGRGQNIWHIPWWHLSECRGHYRVSPPSRATPSLSLSHQLNVGNIQISGRGKERWVKGLREKRRSNWTNEWAASLDLDQRGDSWQLERGIDVTFFSNKNCIIAEWAGAGEWRGAVGNLDRVCGARKNFADVLIKNLTTN